MPNFLRIVVACTVAFFCTQLNAQTRVVELTIFAGPGNQTGVQQAWMRLLSEAGVDRVTSKFREGVKPSIDEQDFGGSTVVAVTGVLKNGRLLLPGKRFSRSDAGAIKQYLLRLREDKVDVALADKKAFGLTEKQLKEVHEMLSPEVKISTIDVTPEDALQTLLDDSRLPLQIGSDVLKQLKGGKPMLDDRKGLSIGTALASILQECGAGLAPRRPAGGSIAFHVVRLDDGHEVWPIGWPSELPPVALEPRLFQRQDIRIERFPLSDALAAVAKKCGAQVLYDRAEILNRDINLATTEVSFARKQVTYMVTFGRLLRQSEPPLDIEVRVDEAGRPFAWINVRE